MLFARIKHWLGFTCYVKVVDPKDGAFDAVEAPDGWRFAGPWEPCGWISDNPNYRAYRWRRRIVPQRTKVVFD